jgi:hypothetical protein
VAQSSKRQFTFGVRGLDLNAPVDQLREGFLPFIKNYRRETDGSITPRAGTGAGREVVAGQSPVHSVRRLNDSSTGSTNAIEVVGTGTHLALCATGLGSSASEDTGYSGDPLHMLSWRPAQSTKPYMYAADRSRMRKINYDGDVKQIGLPAPTAAPRAALDAPSYKVVNELDSIVGWVPSGSTVVPTLANSTRVDPASRSITAILYDTGTTGWACVRPDNTTDLNVGMRLRVNHGGGTAETVILEQIFRGATSTTVAGIAYEGAGGPGICSIHLTTPAIEIDVDSMVLLNGTEYVRVLSVHETVDGFTSFRCRTTGNYLSGITALIVPSFRAYFANNHAAAETMRSLAIEFDVALNGVGYCDLTTAVDLSSIAAGLPTQGQDYMAISIWADKPEAISEIKLLLDIDATPGLFDKNYFQKVIRPNDLTPVTLHEQTMLANRQIRTQRTLIDYNPELDADARLYGVRSRDTMPTDEDPIIVARVPWLPEGEDLPQLPTRDGQLDAGQSQWSTVKFRIAELTDPINGRVGSDISRGLKDVGALRLVVVTNDDTVKVRFGGWWIGGGYGPDVIVSGRNRIYRFRGRDSSTGVVSNWSPALFGGVRPQRQKVTVTLDTQSATECDKLDVQIYGGSILGWHYAGTTDNGFAPTFEDTFSDEDLSRMAAQPTGQQNYQLWPQLRPPVTGTSCSVIGNLVSIFGFGTLPTGLAPGSAVKVDGKDLTIHSILSTTKFYTYESAGVVGGSWEIPEPTIEGQPLFGFAGPFHNFCFGWGDPYNPWRLYYTNGNDPDSTQLTHYVDVEGETLVGMVILEDSGRAILFSADAAFAVEPSFTLAQTGGGLFQVRRIPDAPGLFAPWACCDAAGVAAYLAKDGIYATTGGGTQCISSDIRPLFPRGQSQGASTNGVPAPNMTAANATKFTLAYAGRELYFDYVDADGNYRTLVNEKGSNDQWQGWLYETYSPGITRHYAEEGKNVLGTLACGADGKLFRLALASADVGGASFIASLLTPDHHFGDSRQSKYLLDTMLDYSRDGATITVTPGVNHRATLEAATTLNTGSGRTQKVIDLNSGQGLRGKDISLEIATTVTTERPVFYLYEFDFSARPDLSYLRGEDYDMKQQGVLWCRGVWIHADTFGADRDASFEYVDDDGNVGSVAITSINHDAMSERYYAFESPVYVVATRVRPTDADGWEFLGYRLEGEPAPPKSDGPTAWLGDALQARFVQGVIFDIDTAGANIDMRTEIDQNVLQTTIGAAANKGPVNANGRAQLPFSFDTPFITHLIRFNPSAKCRIFDVRVIDEPEPELAYMWWTQQTDLGADGFKFLGDGYLALRSTSNVTLEIIADGSSYFPTFYDASTNTSGARRKLRFRCPVIKAKSFEFKVYAATSAGKVAVFQKDFQIEFKPWGTEGGWQLANPLGDAHYASGARI